MQCHFVVFTNSLNWCENGLGLKTASLSQNVVFTNLLNWYENGVPTVKPFGLKDSCIYQYYDVGCGKATGGGKTDAFLGYLLTNYKLVWELRIESHYYCIIFVVFTNSLNWYGNSYLLPHIWTAIFCCIYQFVGLVWKHIETKSAYKLNSGLYLPIC